MSQYRLLSAPTLRATISAGDGVHCPENLMSLRAVLFDIGDTLWHSQAAPPPEEFRRLAAGRAAEALRRFGLSHRDPALVSRTAWNEMEAAMKRARSSDFVEPRYGEVCQAAMRELGLDLSVEQAAYLLESTYISGSEGGKAPYDDASEVLRELRRRGFRLGVVTNRAFGGERFRADMREAGLDIGWDAESVSVEVGYLKPHRALFDHALDQLGVRPHDALMVGNSLAEDIAGAQRIGMLAAWRRSAPDAEGVVPDFSFDELTELLDLPVLQEAARDS
jgi:HAD superfamily hydrolase (TIGR01549 family)